MEAQQQQHRIKRKFQHEDEDDNNDDDDELLRLVSPSSSSIRMRKDDQTSIQLLIRTLNDSKTLVLHCNPHDTIDFILRRIHSATGIPFTDQRLRLIYAGRQLHLDRTLSDCRIPNDAWLHLVTRMRSNLHPRASQVLEALIYTLSQACRGGGGRAHFPFIKSLLTDFLNLITHPDADQDDDQNRAATYVKMFLSSPAPAALVMLYLSHHKGNGACAIEAVQHFIDSLPRESYSDFAPVLLKFCKMLRSTSAPPHDRLYKLCQTTLASMVEQLGRKNQVNIPVQDIFSSAKQLATKLSQDLVFSMEEAVPFPGPSAADVRDFGAFLTPLIMEERWKCLYPIFTDLLGNVQECLEKVEECIKVRKDKDKGDGGGRSWDQYLSILRELHRIAVLCEGVEDEFWTSLRCNKVALCHLIVRYAKRGEDFKWILEHKELTDFESRRHLVLMLLPEVKDDYEELHEMLIDRSQLLAESFEYISGAEPGSLRGGLFMEFKNEEATGPGVLREWFFMVCQAIFDPQNALFLVCPNDRRRFFPNPASKVDPMHLRYFKFAGRVIALALMHRMQVGIVLDRAFFLQLGGYDVCLEDIKDADPYLYSSCKQILDMDACEVDEDALGLTFVWEVEELGSMKVMELVPGGKLISVNSRNRKEYVDLLVKHRFVTSVAQQVTEFARGFADIVTSEEIRKLCFRSLVLQDLDGMLHGSESPISVDDWKAHTEYNGYKCSDPQICWFWKIVGEMTAEQRKALLFFWTSVKYLPVEGFCGLASRLYIYKSGGGDRLPSSHTCFFRICFPAYSSMAAMQQRLNIITQQHVAYSFGTW